MIWLALLAFAAVLYFPGLRSALTLTLGGALVTIGLVGLLGVPGAILVFALACLALYRPASRRRS